jgi:hypothetical protein
MVVLVDSELEDGLGVSDPGALDERRVMSNLLASKLVRRYRYSDDGPPPDAPVLTFDSGVTVHPEWAVIDPKSKDGLWGVIYSESKKSYTLSGVIGNVVSVAERDTTTDAYDWLPSEQAAARRRADALAAQVAIQGVEADVFITEREFLHKRGGYTTRGTTVCTPKEAVAIISLYLRTQGEFNVLAHFSFNRGLFFWVGTRELLSSSWRWFNACLQHSQGSGDDSMVLLAGSLLQRVDRALEMRDQIHATLNQKQNNDLRDDALAGLDVILVSLMAAFDVAARVAHRVLAISGDEYLAAWQQKRRKGWWEKVRAVEPKLAGVVVKGSQGDHVLTIVRLLRNSVHGAALQGIAYVQSPEPQETMVGLPAADQAELLAAMDAVGGLHTWGVREILPGRSHVDPGVLVDQLFETVLPLLNELMDRTPVELLPHVKLLPGDSDPPKGGAWDPFELRFRQSIRWQLGF